MVSPWLMEGIVLENEQDWRWDAGPGWREKGWEISGLFRIWFLMTRE